MQLPFADGSVDVCYSSNVLEHVPEPWLMAEEMLRVTRPGGLVYLSWTVWFGPWGGHETAPWHFLGGMRARRRYARRHGHEPKNRFGESLFAVTVADGLRWVRRRERGGDAAVMEIRPRYNPWWSWWLLRVPLLRELVPGTSSWCCGGRPVRRADQRHRERREDLAGLPPGWMGDLRVTWGSLRKIVRFLGRGTQCARTSVSS